MVELKFRDSLFIEEQIFAKSVLCEVVTAEWNAIGVCVHFTGLLGV